MKNEDVEKNAGNTGPAGQKVNAVSYAASLASIDEQNEVTGQRRAGNASIRELVRNARFTGALLSAVLKELGKESLDDFCRHTGADVETGNPWQGRQRNWAAPIRRISGWTWCLIMRPAQA